MNSTTFLSDALTPALLWKPAPLHPILFPGGVHVWRAIPNGALSGCYQVLSQDERDRAGRFHFRKDRDRFVYARGVLRTILSRYLDTPPGRLLFEYNRWGKPLIVSESPGLRFNASHSDGLILYAITRDREVGIDVEYIRPDLNTERLAEQFFAPGEVDALRDLEPDERLEAFFSCWTCKEAYVKARGRGLSIALDQFSVSLKPCEPAALLSVQDESGEAARWSLQTLSPGSGYAGALAVEGSGWHLDCWQWAGTVQKTRSTG